MAEYFAYQVFLRKIMRDYPVKNMLYDLTLALITGVFSGILAAAMFFLILRIWKPNIAISDKIVKQIKTNASGEEEIFYYFKFVNKTKADLENVSIDLVLREEYYNGNSKNYTNKYLRLSKPEIKYLIGRDNKNHDIHDNCILMRIKEPLEDLWNGDSECLRVEIDSRHSKSGRRRVIPQNYTDPSNTIINGKFDSGENFNIIK